MENLNSDNHKSIAIIMAGGSGPKLWPKSTEKTPKQFLHLIGEGSMIQNTVMYLLPFFNTEDIYIVTSENFVELVSSQLPMIPGENLILEPFPKNTAPCLALALTTLKDKIQHDTIIMAFPADHHISNVREFQNSLDIAGKVAYDTQGIVTIGISPTRPETAYGYIQKEIDSSDLFSKYDHSVNHTATFAEKPDLDTAKRFIDSGDFLWNCGIFVLRSDTFWSAFEKFLPDQNNLFKIIQKTVGKDMFKETVNDAYLQMQAESMDYAILEKAKNVFVIESSFGWSDLGTWDELHRMMMKDARNNVLIGEVVALNISNSLIIGGQRLIGVEGVENLIVIDSEESLLICKRGKSNDVQEIVNYMKRKQINNFL
jgi:mannose-1-phosphate guanylyltransferase